MILIHVERTRERQGDGAEPDTEEGEGLVAAIGFVGDVCARAATVGEVRRRCSAAVEELPVTGCAPHLDRV